MSPTRSVAASVTVEPPKPPPVMRAPWTPPASPMPRASSTSVSSSGALTSKSSRSDWWLSNISAPAPRQSPPASASAAARVRAFSVTTWRARR
jgi:hypothetical protein